ncbi:MAG: OmpA family protein [Eudoraea sp.]|nr:OmpA family protein [Eudoraea sp.]
MNQSLTNRILLVAVLVITNGISQNLVINPSFESHKNCPDRLGNFNEDLNAWSTPTNGSTDYFHACSEAMGTPKNFNGTQISDFGEGYAGFYLYAPNDYREYMQAELAEPLKKGETYELSFFVSLAERSDFAINEFGAVFSKNKIDLQILKALSKMQLYKDKENKFSSIVIGYSHFANDTKDWMLVTTDYVAKGTEKYLILGNFKSNARTRKFLFKKGAKQGAYYYIDMVSLKSKNQSSLQPVVDAETNNESYELNKTHLFKHVLFDFDKYTLLSSAKEHLKKTYDYLEEDPSLRMVIHGHTDNIGTPGYNHRLSNKRCKAVADYFLALGLAEDRISWEGHGGTLPITENTSAAGRQKNRRVEFILTKQ